MGPLGCHKEGLAVEVYASAAGTASVQDALADAEAGNFRGVAAVPLAASSVAAVEEVVAAGSIRWAAVAGIPSKTPGSRCSVAAAPEADIQSLFETSRCTASNLSLLSLSVTAPVAATLGQVRIHYRNAHHTATHHTRSWRGVAAGTAAGSIEGLDDGRPLRRNEQLLSVRREEVVLAFS